jgi:hypothetical protein
MQLKWFRLSTMLMVCLYEIIQYYASHSAWTSYAAHIGGSFAGVFVSIVIVRNVAVRQHEIKLTWICVFLYTLMCILLCTVPPAQPAPALAAFCLVPVLVTVAAYWTRKLAADNDGVIYIDEDVGDDQQQEQLAAKPVAAVISAGPVAA